MTSAIDYVATLATALDSDDYETAASVMAPDIEYVIGEERLSGPDAIVASYRAASEMAHRIFDTVGYDHEVVATDDPTLFHVHYDDILTVGEETLTHNALQHVRAEAHRGVVHITNVDLPGEREKLNRFLARHGRSRETTG